jgi:very-short-patch-repair endonuclease
MNADLPIAFDGWGRLEVDLLCVDSRVAVEVDGAQHLSYPGAYRRDRRKDQLLQENGYLVLRISPRTSPRNWTQCLMGYCGR